MAITYLKPDYASKHFMNWQTKNPGLQADEYNPSFEFHRRSDPTYVMGTDPTWDAEESFLRSIQTGYKPTMQEAHAFQSNEMKDFTPPSEDVESAEHVPNYTDVPGTMVSQHAVDTGFELTPGIHWEIVDQLPDYTIGQGGNPIEGYGRKIGEPSPNILSTQYEPGIQTPQATNGLTGIQTPQATNGLTGIQTPQATNGLTGMQTPQATNGLTEIPSHIYEKYGINLETIQMLGIRPEIDQLIFKLLGMDY